MRPLGLALLVAVVFGLPHMVFAAKLQSELTITSDKLEMDENREVATFIGGVVAREGEMALYADRMVVYYFKKGKHNSRGGVHKVDAIGHVVIEQAANKGQADRAEYIVGDRKLTLIGKENIASILHGGDQLSGKQILLMLGHDRKIENVSVLGGGNKRVSARILPANVRKQIEETSKKQQINQRYQFVPSEPLPSPVIAPLRQAAKEKLLTIDSEFTPDGVPKIPPKRRYDR